MNKGILQNHIKTYEKEKAYKFDQFEEDWTKRDEHIKKYQGYNKDKNQFYGQDEDPHI